MSEVGSVGCLQTTVWIRYFLPVFPLLRARPPDEDGELPPSEPVRLGGPRDDRPDEVQHRPGAAGGPALRPGPVFRLGVLGGGRLGPLPGETSVRGPGQADQAGQLCEWRPGGPEGEQEEVQGGARPGTEAAQVQEMSQEALWLHQLSGCEGGGSCPVPPVIVSY